MTLRHRVRENPGAGSATERCGHILQRGMASRRSRHFACSREQQMRSVTTDMGTRPPEDHVRSIEGTRGIHGRGAVSGATLGAVVRAATPPRWGWR